MGILSNCVVMLLCDYVDYFVLLLPSWIIIGFLMTDIVYLCLTSENEYVLQLNKCSIYWVENLTCRQRCSFQGGPRIGQINSDSRPYHLATLCIKCHKSAYFGWEHQKSTSFWLYQAWTVVLSETTVQLNYFHKMPCQMTIQWFLVNINPEIRNYDRKLTYHI